MAAFIAGGLPDVEQSLVRIHLDDCDECRAAVRVGRRAIASPSMTLTVLAESSGTKAAHGRESAMFAPGTMVGPYVLERLLGAGGMGLVYAARDARLDRTVALKVIRQTPGTALDQLVERLRRESKALARLSHPNVTTVYELGSADGEIYIAMEYVAGSTLRAWLADEQRDPKAILATFVEAGRGLAAAHAASLIHRDFKPDNVMIDARGAVKVTDFGLATLAKDIRVGAPTADVARFDTEITRTGALIGTPAYMAPEQFRGAQIDARADQFAFCVALYEALVGNRPFRGDSIAEVERSVLAGLADMPRTRRIPARVRRAIVRGLAVDPETRFPTMDALLAALAPRRRSVMVGVALATVGAWGVVATTLLASDDTARPPALCQTAGTEVQAVWNPEQRAVLATAFENTGAPGAAATSTAVAARLDDFAQAWSAMHVASCKATHVQGTQSLAALDLRTGCLERRRAQLAALVGVFERADASVVSHAREAVVALPPLTSCADVEGLARRTPLPTDSAAKARY
ncbi:MAG: serine/threonine protein kinase, partial [Myxococcota bacterium]|nr:serine/threonine protein kinase [Myxococcota bacterium]